MLPINQYCEAMEEVRRRIHVTTEIVANPEMTPYPATTLDLAYLQIRKVLELIAMASLVANHDQYARAHSNFAKHWRAKEILTGIEAQNPDFYPCPIIEKPSNDPMSKFLFEPRVTGFLTRDQFVELYDFSAGVLHVGNPFGQSFDYSRYEHALPDWTSRIVNLLNSHIIRLVDEAGFWLIHMNEKRDERVHAYVFHPEPPSE
ncbi:MAG TPA: hypothetical protein PKC43_08850 [Phycisphaerales bacterium]|nr:hypothetical protein [Phycisphaerales bacterium]HMP37544.1 hypothetical protein [Phycisphaerales bacterium]